MVDETLQAVTDERRLARLSARMQFGWANAGSDAVAMVGSYLVADAVRAFVLSALNNSPAGLTLDWSVAVFVAAVASVFYVSGLYAPEAYVSRPLHLWTVLKAALAAFVVSALSIYLIRSDIFDESRLVLVLTFAVFVVFAGVLRLVVLDSVGATGYSNTIRYPCSWGIQRRLRRWRCVCDICGGLTGWSMSSPRRRVPTQRRPLPPRSTATWSNGAGVVSVFVDATSLKPRAAFEAAAAAQALGAEVYVVSPLLKTLEGNRLLSKLFEAPVIRLRGSIEHAKPYAAKRALDVVDRRPCCCCLRR